MANDQFSREAKVRSAEELNKFLTNFLTDFAEVAGVQELTDPSIIVNGRPLTAEIVETICSNLRDIDFKDGITVVLHADDSDYEPSGQDEPIIK